MTELDYFQIEGAHGGSQDWFSDPMMKAGGCAAVCACDSCVYFTLKGGMSGLYPFDAQALTKQDYVAFSKMMRPYLRPRFGGISEPQTYIDGFSRYLSDRHINGITMTALSGDGPLGKAWDALTEKIDHNLPVPCLILRHSRKEFSDYEWHWFLLTGYDMAAGDKLVKAATYGSARWLSFSGLWNTGFDRRGGLVLYQTR